MHLGYSFYSFSSSFGLHLSILHIWWSCFREKNNNACLFIFEYTTTSSAYHAAMPQTSQNSYICAISNLFSCVTPIPPIQSKLSPIKLFQPHVYPLLTPHRQQLAFLRIREIWHMEMLDIIPI